MLSEILINEIGKIIFRLTSNQIINEEKKERGCETFVKINGHL